MGLTDHLHTILWGFKLDMILQQAWAKVEPRDFLWHFFLEIGQKHFRGKPTPLYSTPLTLHGIITSKAESLRQLGPDIQQTWNRTEAFHHHQENPTEHRHLETAENFKLSQTVLLRYTAITEPITKASITVCSGAAAPRSKRARADQWLLTPHFNRQILNQDEKEGREKSEAQSPDFSAIFKWKKEWRTILICSSPRT